jgi:peptidyl-prolyl cis-trans isomerase D
MVNLFRKYQQTLMIVITILVIIAFVLLYNGTRSTGRPAGSDDVGKIYGRTVTRLDVDREVRKFGIARKLELGDLLGSLAGQSQTQDEAVTNYFWNGLVLRHQADVLQIAPTDDDVKTAIMNIDVFKTNDAFDSGKYAEFVDSVLSANGFTTAQLEDLVRDDLRLKRIKELLGASFEISPSMFRTIYGLQYQKMDVSVIRFNLTDFAAGIQVTEDDIKKTYEQQKAGYQSGEKRAIKLVTFSLSDADKALTGKERTEALQKLSNRANDFTQAMLEKNAKFDDVAAKFQVPVTATQPFGETKPDPAVANLDDLVVAAFRLTKDQPDSDAIQHESNFYIAHLEQVVPSRQLSLDEARPEIIEQIKLSRAHETLSLKAAEVHKKIQADLSAGKPFADAVTAAGVKAEAFPPFSLSEPPLDKPDVREVTVRSVEMNEGQLSDFVPTPDGGIIIHLDKREPLDEKKFGTVSLMMEPAYKREKLRVIFADWLRKQREDAQIQVPRAPTAARQ